MDGKEEARGTGVAFDPDTLFFAAGICAAALAMTMLSMWFQNRVDRFLIGWMLGMALIAGGVILYSTVPPGHMAVTAIAFTLEIAGFVAVYVAARLFTGEPTSWAPVLALGLAVALVVAVPIAFGRDGIGIMVYNFLRRGCSRRRHGGTGQRGRRPRFPSSASRRSTCCPRSPSRLAEPCC